MQNIINIREKSKEIIIQSNKLLGTLFSQLRFCSEQSKQNGFISQENLGRILAVNSILIEHYRMSWGETKELFSDFGLETSMINNK